MAQARVRGAVCGDDRGGQDRDSAPQSRGHGRRCGGDPPRRERSVGRLQPLGRVSTILIGDVNCVDPSEGRQDV